MLIEGDSLPVSAFLGYEDAHMENGSTACKNIILLTLFLNGVVAVSNVTNASSHVHMLLFVRS